MSPFLVWSPPLRPCSPKTEHLRHVVALPALRVGAEPQGKGAPLQARLKPDFLAGSSFKPPPPAFPAFSGSQPGGISMHLPLSTSRGSRCCVWEPGKLQEVWHGVLLGGVGWSGMSWSRAGKIGGVASHQGSHLWSARAQEMGLWKRKRKDGVFWAGDV